jgi:hypothetical protein
MSISNPFLCETGVIRRIRSRRHQSAAVMVSARRPALVGHEFLYLGIAFVIDPLHAGL